MAPPPQDRRKLQVCSMCQGSKANPPLAAYPPWSRKPWALIPPLSHGSAGSFFPACPRAAPSGLLPLRAGQSPRPVPAPAPSFLMPQTIHPLHLANTFLYVQAVLLHSAFHPEVLLPNPILGCFCLMRGETSSPALKPSD